MLMRPIPATGEALPVIGIGTWRGFDVGRGRRRAACREVLAALFEAGGSVIDSSPMYGRAEAVVGDLLAAMDGHDKAFVATKVWTSGERAGIGQMEASLAKLGVRRIDLMQIHNLVDWRTQLRTLRRWKEEGRARYLGVTHYTVSAFDRLEDVLAEEPLDFVQLPFSIAVPDAEDRLLGLAAERGVAVLANRPLDGGGLFRAVRGRDLPPWAVEAGCASWAQFFLTYVISHPAVTCAIPGTGNPDHARDALAAGAGWLPDAVGRRRMLDYWNGV